MAIASRGLRDGSTLWPPGDMNAPDISAAIQNPEAWKAFIESVVEEAKAAWKTPEDGTRERADNAPSGVSVRFELEDLYQRGSEAEGYVRRRVLEKLHGAFDRYGLGPDDIVDVDHLNTSTPNAPPAQMVVVHFHDDSAPIARLERVMREAGAETAKDVARSPHLFQMIGREALMLARKEPVPKICAVPAVPTSDEEETFSERALVLMEAVPVQVTLREYCTHVYVAFRATLVQRPEFSGLVPGEDYLIRPFAEVSNGFFSRRFMRGWTVCCRRRPPEEE